MQVMSEKSPEPLWMAPCIHVASGPHSPVPCGGSWLWQWLVSDAVSTWLYTALLLHRSCGGPGLHQLHRSPALSDFLLALALIFHRSPGLLIGWTSKPSSHTKSQTDLESNPTFFNNSKLWLQTMERMKKE
jgi:hypothetical protein